MTAERVLASISNTSDETEFYTPMPAGYKPGKTKYVGVFGTVMSGLGKGIFASSLAKVLKDKGLTVAPIKLEGYLNLDSGTLNPFRHGEVFVLDDGMECDMDLGTYERMLDQNMTRDNFSTSGQIFSAVLEKERRGGYLGRDVQMIPHVTGEVKSKLRRLAVNTDADVVFIEIGGTVGDVENAYYIEAAGMDILNAEVIGVVVETKCNFRSSVAYPEALVAGLRVAHLGRTSVRWEIGIFGPDQETAAAFGHFVHVFVDRASNTPVPIPPRIRAALERLVPVRRAAS